MVTVRSPLDGIQFQGRDPRESFQFYFRQHWIRMLWPFSRTVLATLGVFVGGYFSFFVVGIQNPDARWLTSLFLFAILILFHLDFLLRFYRYFLYITVVTDKRVHRIKKTLLTTNTHESIDLWILQDIHKFQRGVFQNLFGFGTLRLEGQETHMNIHFTPRITPCYAALMSLLEQARMQAATQQQTPVSPLESPHARPPGQ